MRFVLLGNGRPLDVARTALYTQEVLVAEHHTDEAIRAFNPDVGLCIGYRHLLDADTIAIPTHGWFNIHSSLLPKYKGRAPVNWAILNGETELGATLHVIDETVDGGDIVAQQRFALAPDEDAGDALRRLEDCYTRLVWRLVEGLTRGFQVSPQPANDERPWPARTDEDGEVDWSQPAEQVLRLVRASAPPYPGAWVVCGDGRKLRILKASVE